MMNQRLSVPSYHLYGEYRGLPDLVHCEAIATRSVLHGWTIKAHRHHRLHQFFLVLSGGGTFNLDDDTGQLQPPLVLNVPPQAIHGFQFAPETKGWVVTIPTELLDFPTAHDLQPVLATPMRIAAPIAAIDLFAQIVDEYDRHDVVRNHNLHALVMLLAGHIARTALLDETIAPSTTEPLLIRQFRDLVEQHFRSHWPLARYAQELGATTTHLTRLSKQHIGVPASKLIEVRLIQEARRDLTYSNVRISDIAYALGFTDPAYFTRVFLRSTGMTPSAFRTNLQDHVS